jgi:hypothetical protein
MFIDISLERLTAHDQIVLIIPTLLLNFIEFPTRNVVVLDRPEQ